MKNKKIKHLGLEIDPELHYKLSYIAKYYERSATRQIMYLISQEIRKFEASDGEITVPEDVDD